MQNNFFSTNVWQVSCEVENYYYDFISEQKKRKRFCRLAAQGKPEVVAAVIHIKRSGGVLQLVSPYQQQHNNNTRKFQVRKYNKRQSGQRVSHELLFFFGGAFGQLFCQIIQTRNSNWHLDSMLMLTEFICIIFSIIYPSHVTPPKVCIALS